MNDNTSIDKFGCKLCWPKSADAAWLAIQKTKRGEEVRDDSHCHIMLRACGYCSQHFVSVFSERIYCAGDEFPHHWAVLPITWGEVKSLRYSLSHDPFALLQPDRRSLQANFPKGAGVRIFWSTGLVIGNHH